MTALGSDSISVSETKAVETVFAKENQERELMDVVYFRSENGVAELSEVLFENEKSKTLGNVKQTVEIPYDRVHEIRPEGRFDSSAFWLLFTWSNKLDSHT